MAAHVGKEKMIIYYNTYAIRVYIQGIRTGHVSRGDFFPENW